MVAEQKPRSRPLPAAPTTAATPEELELYFLSSLRSLDRIQKAVQAGVRDESFQVDEYGNVWKYLLARSRQGVLPTFADVQAVTSVALVDEITDEPTYQDDLITRTVYRMVVAKLLELNDTLDRNPRLATQKLVGDLGQILATGGSHNRDYLGGARERLARVQGYAEMVARGETIGIRTGLSALDNDGNAWRPGEVIAIQGPLNVGKSFLLLWFCAHALYHSNAKILFMTPEMTIDEVELRLDPMIAQFMGLELSNQRLRTGTPDMGVYGDFVTRVETSGLMGSWYTRDSGAQGYFTVEELLDACREIRPDIMAIDGVHLIRGSGKSWETMKEASEQLKGIAQNQGCVIIGNTQVVRNAVIASDDTADLSQSAYGMAFLEAADRVIAIADKRGEPNTRIWKMPKNRTGTKIVARQYMHFDVDKGIIGDRRVHENVATGMVVPDDGDDF